MRGTAALVPLIVVVLLSAARFYAQDAQSTPRQPTFRSGANLVRVDVTAVDSHGEPVTNLTTDDFEIEEDGVPQTVDAFQLISATGHPDPRNEESLPIRSPEHAAAEAAREDVRVFVIFWDEYHIGRLESAYRAREAVGRFVATAFGPTDLVALMDALLPIDALRFSRDRSELSARVRDLKGRLGVYIPSRSFVEDEMNSSASPARLRAEVTISAIKAAAVYLGGLREGRKSIVLVSEGVWAFGPDGRELLRDLTQTANANNVAIYSVDPRGLGRIGTALSALAQDTGGRPIVTNNPERLLRQMVKDASAFYLLGYVSARNPSDGHFHRITVRVRRPGVEVHARNGYWAPTLSDMDSARKAVVDNAVPSAVATALATLTPPADRLVSLWVGASRADGGEPRVTVVWTPMPARSATRGMRGYTVSVDAPRVATRGLTAELARGLVTFTASPGPLAVRASVRDPDGNIVDEHDATLVVPDFVSAPLTLTTPVVFRAQSEMEARVMRSAPDPMPSAVRQFARTDRMWIRFAVGGSHAVGAPPSVRLIGRTGKTLVALAAMPVEGTGGGYEVTVPLTSIARGDYVISITVGVDAERVEELVSLRIIS